MLHIGAPPGLEQVVDATAPVRVSSKPKGSPGALDFAREFGGLASIYGILLPTDFGLGVVPTIIVGENSPMKIRVGSFFVDHSSKSVRLPPLREVERSAFQSPTTPSKMGAGMSHFRHLDLQRAAYAETNSVSTLSFARCRRSLPPIDAYAGKNSQSGKGLDCTAGTASGARAQFDIQAGQEEVSSLRPCGVEELMNRLALERESIRFMDVLPHLSVVAQCRKGSRFLQEYIPDAFRDGVPPLVFDAFLRDLIDLSVQQYSHAIILSLLEVATGEQKRVLVERLAIKVGQLCTDTYGCRVIQKVIQVVPTDYAELLIEGLKGDVVHCVKNMHANHVIQVCIQELPPSSLIFLLEAVESWGADATASHVYGCRVVMRLLEHIPRDKLQTILTQIIEKTPRLAQDRYGNYVLQHIIDNGCLLDRQALITEVLEYGALTLAVAKYAHNVVERCVRLTMSDKTLTKNDGASLQRELLWRDDLAPVLKLASSRFGAKVLVCFWNGLEIPEREQVRQALVEGKEIWQDLPHAMHVLEELSIDLSLPVCNRSKTNQITLTSLVSYGA